MPDPVSRLRFCRDEIDKTFGAGFAQANPNLVAAVMLSASMDFHGLTLARVLEDVAHALAEEEPIVPVRRGLTRG
jgi:hypothetical protein